MICEEKNKYSKATAQKACDRIGRKEGIRLRIYQCDLCGAWHLTSKTNWSNKINKIHVKNNKRKKRWREERESDLY